MQVSIAGLPVGSGLTIPVGDLSKVKVEGLEHEVVANKETEFVVDATAAGPAEMAVEVLDGNGAPVTTETEVLAPQKWKVKYVILFWFVCLPTGISLQVHTNKCWSARSRRQVLRAGCAWQPILSECV